MSSSVIIDAGSNWQGLFVSVSTVDEFYFVLDLFSRWLNGSGTPDTVDEIGNLLSRYGELDGAAGISRCGDVFGGNRAIDYL